MKDTNADAKSLRQVRSWSWSIPVLALLATLAYVSLARASGLTGFPLDDAWIHQTYARNLAETGQLAYLPGQPSAGSTSPSWSFLLSVGYLLGLDYGLWAHLLGGLSLAAAAWLTYHLLLQLPSPRPHPGARRQAQAAILAGLLCAVEWHLVWAAASGMETMLFIALSLALLAYYANQVTSRGAPGGPASLQTERTVVNAVGIGLLGGILTLTRPEGLVLAGLVIGALAVFPLPSDRSEVQFRLLTTGISLLALGVLLTPYLFFNFTTSGSLFPNTYYAKQAEYRLGGSFLVRLWRVLTPTFIGAQVLLVPGFGYAVYRLLRERNWPALLPFAWWSAFLVLYALRLPVSYQHGRYTMPTIPILILYGILGTASLLQPRSSSLLGRVLSRAVPVAVGLLALLFWARGAMAYRDDVAFIDGEMVSMAHWLNANTAADDLLAVHDIGAVGYLTDRPLLDLAGLITPEVIPFITDAGRLLSWMEAQDVAYAVFFPDFSPTYEQLATDPRLQAIYCTGYAWTREQGHDNMCVYRLSPPGQVHSPSLDECLAAYCHGCKPDAATPREKSRKVAKEVDCVVY